SVMTESRCLCDDSRIDVDDAIAAVCKQRAHVAKHCAAVRAAPTLVAFRKVHANVSERGGTEQRVAYRVQQHVPVRVRQDPMRVRDLDTAKRHELARRERMNVETLADAKLAHRSSRAARMRAARSRSGGVVIFRLSQSHSTSFGRSPRNSIACASSVTQRPCWSAASSARTSSSKRNI